MRLDDHLYLIKIFTQDPKNIEITHIYTLQLIQIIFFPSQQTLPVTTWVFLKMASSTWLRKQNSKATQSSSNQSNEFGLSINQFNPKASKNLSINQVLVLGLIDWLIAAQFKRNTPDSSLYAYATSCFRFSPIIIKIDDVSWPRRCHVPGLCQAHFDSRSDVISLLNLSADFAINLAKDVSTADSTEFLAANLTRMYQWTPQSSLLPWKW
jgi:hypothetical protein